MALKMDDHTKAMYKRHKIYKWIALFIKIVSIPLLHFVFRNAEGTITLPYSGAVQARSAFLSTLCALIIYYAIIFFFNREKNFKSQTSLGKCIAVYTLVVLILLTLESIYSTPIQNLLYGRVLHLPYTGDVISAATVGKPYVYLGLGFAVQLGFGFVTSLIIFNLFRFVLNRQDRLDRI